MTNTLVIVANCAHARLFTLKQPEVPEMESGPKLEEIGDLINPEGQIEGKALWENNKSGRNRSGSNAHGYDDHRYKHEGEITRRFAVEIFDAIKQHPDKTRIILVAGAQMLPHLRREAVSHPNRDIEEHHKDLIKLSAVDIHTHLADAGLIPQMRSI